MSTWAFSDSAAPGSRRRVASEGEDAASTLPTPPSAARHVATASSLAAASRFQHSTRMTPLNRHGHLGANLAAALVDGNMAAAVQGHHRSTTQQTSYRSPSSDSSRQSYGTPSTTSHPSTDFSPRRQPDGGGTRRRSLPTDNMFGIEGLTVNFSGYDFSGNSAEVQGQSFFQGDPAIAAALDEFGDFLAQENILRGGQGGAQSALFGAMNHVDGGELSQLGQSVPLGNHQFLVPDQSQAPSAQSTLKRKAPATSEAWRSHFQAAANSSPYDPRPATAPLPSTKPLPSPASPGLGEWHSGYASDVSSSAYSPMLPAGSPFFPPMVRSPLAPQAIDPMSLVYPERLPVFPYMASNEVLAEARMPDIMPDDDPGGRFKRAGGVPRKRDNEKHRREAFKAHLTSLVHLIPGMELHSQTRKSICVCAREYIQQLQRREQRLRAQLMAHRLREQALVTALLQRGFSAEDIAALSAEASVNDLDSVAALVEGMVSDPKAG